MGAILSVIPKSALALAVAVLAALLMAQTFVAQRNAGRLADERAARATERAAWVEASASSAARERATEQKWSTAHQELTNAYTHVAAQLVADRVDADTAGGRLRDSARSYAARTCRGGANSAAPGSSAPAAPDFLLAELFGVVEQAGRDMATEARRRTEELADCVARYDSLSLR